MSNDWSILLRYTIGDKAHRLPGVYRPKLTEGVRLLCFTPDSFFEANEKKIKYMKSKMNMTPDVEGSQVAGNDPTERK